MRRKSKCKLIVIILINCIILKAQRKDSTLFSNYYLCGNFISRIIVVGDLGVERVKQIKSKFYYASQVSITTNFRGTLAPIYKTSPAYYGFLIQPFHLLIGGSLKYEIGPALSFLFYRYKGSQYPIDTVRITNSYNTQIYDIMTLSLTNGLRYTFKKSQISIKVLIGTRYIINIQRDEPQPYYLRLNSVELGLNWRFRKKKYIKINP
ncbi:MAG: hypothetical protein ABIP51_16060 [Bacteroidia bacterium]